MTFRKVTKIIKTCVCSQFVSKLEGVSVISEHAIYFFIEITTMRLLGASTSIEQILQKLCLVTVGQNGVRIKSSLSGMGIVRLHRPKS